MLNKVESGVTSMKKYKCVEPFSVTEYDYDGFPIEDSEINIVIDSIWVVSENNYMSDIRLENHRAWIEIPKEVFTRNFEEIEEG